MTYDGSPAARALLALELIQNTPGITARKLADRLGVTERAVRRYVAILREADLPVEAMTGPYGGYRLGRGMRIPPLMFTAAEAMGLAMAVLEGHRHAADPADPVGSALAKILRVLPERLAGPMRAVREVSGPAAEPGIAASPELITVLIESCTSARLLRLSYRLGQAKDRPMEVEPWAVVLRHSRWYLLCWSRTRQALRVLRVDRITAVEALAGGFTPPQHLDALRTLEEHLSQGWTYPVDVLVEATPAATARWIPRSLGKLEPGEDGRTRLCGSTDNPDWYARELAAIQAPIRVLGSPELQAAVAGLGRQLMAAARPEVTRMPGAGARMVPGARSELVPGG